LVVVIWAELLYPHVPGEETFRWQAKP
jgi:hypothetical protein